MSGLMFFPWPVKVCKEQSNAQMIAFIRIMLQFFCVCLFPLMRFIV